MNKTLIGSAGLNIALIIVLVIALAHGCNKCPEGEIVKITHDTIFVPDIPKAIIVKMPEPVKTIGVASFKPHTTIPVTYPPVPTVVSVSAVSGVLSTATTASPCDSIRLYSDSSFSSNDYHLIVNDTVQGKILGRSVWYVNLRPQITTTIERRLPDRWKVYGGLAFTINGTHMERWGLGPSALVTIPKGFGVSYYYDVHNNAHQGTLFVLIKLKK